MNRKSFLKLLAVTLAAGNLLHLKKLFGKTTPTNTTEGTLAFPNHPIIPPVLQPHWVYVYFPRFDAPTYYQHTFIRLSQEHCRACGKEYQAHAEWLPARMSGDSGSRWFIACPTATPYVDNRWIEYYT